MAPLERLFFEKGVCSMDPQDTGNISCAARQAARYRCNAAIAIALRQRLGEG
jgi:hypothetical protein